MPTSMLYATLTSGLLLFLLCPSTRLTPAVRIGLLFAAMVVATIPINGLSIAVAVRGTVGDLSVFTLCWLLCAAAERIRPGGTPLADQRQRVFAAGAIVVAAIILYPAGMGLTHWDPYRLGYGLSVVGASLALAITAYYLRQQFTLLAITACLAAYALLLLESRNFWDYLLDPALSVYALILLLRHARGRSKKQTGVLSQHG